MRLSQLFTKTSKTAPADEVAKNAQLLIRAGYVHKEMAGVYTFLPLGLKVLDNVCTIIREEMDAIGGQELKLTSLQDPEVWKKSGRWDDDAVDVWFKTKLKNDTEIGLGWTQEEPLVRAVRPYVNSYKDLPFLAYQIQTKFRNETRAKSGVMRGREFLMKDMYSFARTQMEHDQLYEQISQAYHRVFERLGIGDKTFLTFASGGAFSQYSHEFQTITDAGEDIIYIDNEKKIAVNEEVYNDAVLAELGLSRDAMQTAKSAEVGNIFTLKDKFSTPLNLVFTDEDGQEKPVLMGCYGIGPSRLVGVITELLADERGLVWPENIAPFKVVLIRLGDNNHVQTAADAVYSELTSRGVGVVYDDRDARAGEKFADADLIGIPYRVVVSDKTIAQGSDQTLYEVKRRTERDAELMDQTQLFELLQA